MSKMIQIRNVPDKVHATLKARAASEGMSLSDFIKRELGRSVERLTLQEWFESVRKHKPIKMKQTSAELIRALRGE